MPEPLAVTLSRAVGQRIRQCRREHGWTQAQLGEMFEERSHGAISNIERGRTRLDLVDLHRLATIFGISASWLCFGDETAGTTLCQADLANMSREGRIALTELVQVAVKVLQNRPKATKTPEFARTEREDGS